MICSIVNTGRRQGLSTFEQAYVEDNYDIDVSFPHNHEVLDLISNHSFDKLISIPSIEIYRNNDPKIRAFDKVSGFYLIKIWNKLNIRVAIMKHHVTQQANLI